VKKPLMDGKYKTGELFICYSIHGNEDELIVLSLESKDINSKRAFLWFCPDSYYFTITKPLQGRTIEVYRSEPTKLPSHSFEAIRISSRLLCNQKFNQEFTFNFHNYSSNILIGQTTCMLAQL
jgi:hypothetical protein